jgi:hypothetical protein
MFQIIKLLTDYLQFELETRFMPAEFGPTRSYDDLRLNFARNQTDLYAGLFQKTKIRDEKFAFSVPLYEV